MPLPVITGVVRCAVQGTVPSGQKWVNVWHARFHGGVPVTASSDIDNLDALLFRVYSGTVFGTGFGWLNACIGNVAMSQITYLPLDGTSLSIVKAHVAIGNFSGNSTPSECAQVLTLRSALRGRSNRGRVYLPCPAANNVDPSGRLLAAVRDAVLTQVAGVKNALGGPAVAPFWELGVASYLNGTFEPLAQATMDLDLDVQRRRKS
jgi:hypothetical protein